MTADASRSEGRKDGPEARAQRARRPADALPCLNSNNSNEDLSSGHRRTAYALQENVRHLAERFGLEKLGFLTLTFRDHVTDIKEAQRRFNSLRTGILTKRYAAFITVVERMASGRIHFHLLVVCAQDIRSGFDFAAVKRKDYRTANAWLRQEWGFWRRTAPDYGFGRTELMPVKSNAEGLAKYLGKYIAKHIGNRRPEDKGARLVRYSVSGRQVGTNFAFVSPRATVNRRKLAGLSAFNGIKGPEGWKRKLGRHWFYHLKDLVAKFPLDAWSTVDHVRADPTGPDLRSPEFDDAVDIHYRRGAEPEVQLETVRDKEIKWIDPEFRRCKRWESLIERLRDTPVDDDPNDLERWPDLIERSQEIHAEKLRKAREARNARKARKEPTEGVWIMKDATG